MYDVSTTRVFVRYKTVLYLTKTLVVETSYIAIIALVLLHECSPSLLLIRIKYICGRLMQVGKSVNTAVYMWKLEICTAWLNGLEAD